MSYQTIQVNHQLRFVEREAKSDHPHLIYVLHGYGQLAFYFLQKFKNLDDRYHVIAPEGLHRFYVQGTSGRVGASWMTKEGRELDIENNTAALDSLHQSVLNRLNPKTITVLGFSQGGATASRWVEFGKIAVDTFISWASVYPPDLEELSTKKGVKRKVFVLGNQDQFYDANAQEKIKSDYLKRAFDIVTFDGKHDIDTQTLQTILASYE